MRTYCNAAFDGRLWKSVLRRHCGWHSGNCFSIRCQPGYSPHGVDGLIIPNADFESLADGIVHYHADREHLVRSSVSARDRALVNTKSHWHQICAQIIRTHPLPTGTILEE